MLEIAGLDVAYGLSRALNGLDLSVPRNELRAIIGPNGAGKTTLLKAILGLVPVASGRILLDGKDIVGDPIHRVARRGVAWVSEGRGILRGMTVEVNLELGAYMLDDARQRAENLATAYRRFPVLRERRAQLAGTLSGGEQQMLAIARAVMSNPRLVLVDEPSLGLAPLVVNDVFRILAEIHRSGTTMLLVEQNARKAMAIADWVYVLETGSLVYSGEPSAALRDGHVVRTYLGHG